MSSNNGVLVKKIDLERRTEQNEASPLERFGTVRVTLGSPWKKSALEPKDYSRVVYCRNVIFIIQNLPMKKLCSALILADVS